MNNQKILFGGIALALFFVSCGKSTTDSPIADDGTVQLYGAKVATTIENLPTCDSTQVGQLFFVLAEESFQFCSSTGYESIDLQGIAGEDGADGSSCSVIANDNESKTILCEDGTTATVHDGASCVVKDNYDNSYDLTCSGTTVKVRDGKDGVNGVDGVSCLATQRNDSLFIDCSGVLDTIVNGADGTDGADGASCTITDDGMGTLTQTCGVTSNSWPKDVCGTQAYEPSTHFCDERIVWELCGGLSYDPGTYFCDIRDDKTYKYVTIGSQAWMAENLNYGVMVTSAEGQVNDAVVEKYCYDDDVDHCSTDGGLYSWAESMDFLNTCNTNACASQISTGHHQGICPAGWHIPKAAEWDALATNLGGIAVAGGKMKLNTTGFTNWDAVANNDGNSSGFSAFPAGFRYNLGDFDDRGSNVFFWEAIELNASFASFRNLYFGSNYLLAYDDSKLNGFSVRCLRDN